MHRILLTCQNHNRLIEYKKPNPDLLQNVPGIRCINFAYLKNPVALRLLTWNRIRIQSPGNWQKCTLFYTDPTPTLAKTFIHPRNKRVSDLLTVPVLF
jgi:hypothetical protein